MAPSLVFLALLVAWGLFEARAGGRATTLAVALIALGCIATPVGRLDQFTLDLQRLYPVFLEVRIYLLAWALVLWLPPPQRGPQSASSQRSLVPDLGNDRVLMAGVLLVGLTAIVLVDAMLVNATGTTGGTDEVLYRFQARLFGEGRLRAPLPEALRPHFATVSTVPTGDAFHTQYPPGWPVVLAAFELFGLARYAAPVMGLLCLLGVAKLASRWIGVGPAAVAVLLLLLNVHFLRWSSGLFSHAMVGATAVWTAVLVDRAYEARSGRVWAWALGAGLLSGLAFTARPLTALALTASVWGFAILKRGLRSAEGRAFAARLTAGMLLGALPGACAFLLYNAATNGGMLEFGYSAAHEGGHALGFGEHTRVRYLPDGSPSIETLSYGPIEALQRFVGMAATAIGCVLPAALALPVAWACVRAGYPLRWRALTFLALPVAYFFWSTATYRSWSEVLPFVALLLASMLVWLAKREPVWARRLVVLCVFAGLVRIPGWVNRDALRSRQWTPPVRAVEELASEGPVLVFVDRRDEVNEGLFEKLWGMNTWPGPGDVVVARDLGARNAVLVERYPDHRPYRLWREGVGSTGPRESLMQVEPWSPGR